MTPRFLHSALLFALFLLAGLLSVTGPLANTDTPRSPTILVLGDSLSAAYRLRKEQGWVARLQQRLQDEHLPHHLVNASISGETSSGGLSRLANALKKYQPEVVILELGANDGLRGLALRQLRQNLQQMITLAQQQGAKVLLLGMRLPPNYGPAYTKGFAQLYVDLARQYHLALVPFLLEGVATEAGMMQSDGLHPNARGQQRILETVWSRLTPLLTPQQ